MKRFREFKGTITHIEYDAERGTFESVVEVHPFLDHAKATDDLAAYAATNTKAANERATVPGTSGQPPADSETRKPDGSKQFALAS